MQWGKCAKFKKLLKDGASVCPNLEVKCVIAESLNRVMKSKWYKKFTHYKTYRCERVGRVFVGVRRGVLQGGNGPVALSIWEDEDTARHKRATNPV